MRKLALLTPPPWLNLTRFHGIFSPNAKKRPLLRALLPVKQDEGQSSAAGASVRVDAELMTPAEQESPAATTPRQSPSAWAELLRRTIGVDVLICPSCQGRMRLIAMIKEQAAIHRILRHLGLPTEVPETLPARAPPQLDFDLLG